MLLHWGLNLLLMVVCGLCKSMRKSMDPLVEDHFMYSDFVNGE
jgi:hypothetical protein